MVRSWDDLRAPFMRVTFARIRACGSYRGVREIAAEIPAGKSTVYRLLAGEVEAPSIAVRAGIERLVEKHAQQLAPADE